MSRTMEVWAQKESQEELLGQKWIGQNWLAKNGLAKNGLAKVGHYRMRRKFPCNKHRRGPTGFTQQPENSKRAHFRPPAFKNTTKIGPPREEERKKNVAEKGKKREFLVFLPPLRGPPSGPTLQGPPFGAPLSHKPETAKKWSGPKVVWVKNPRALPFNSPSTPLLSPPPSPYDPSPFHFLSLSICPLPPSGVVSGVVSWGCLLGGLRCRGAGAHGSGFLNPI